MLETELWRFTIDALDFQELCLCWLPSEGLGRETGSNVTDGNWT